ncbi:ATPase component [Pseudomonas syringae pv. actinidiae]|nr:ATPase component [Pseudomonas syringae pv. actinidiae]
MPPQIVPDLHVISTPTMRVGLKLAKVSKREHKGLKTGAARSAQMELCQSVEARFSFVIPYSVKHHLI